MPITVSLLADRVTAADAVATMRWQEWGHPPESDDPAWWLETTLREAGTHDLPVTFVAHDAAEAVLGAIGLDTYDLDERRDTTPWITGMIVRQELRGEGIGRILLEHLERWAAAHGIAEAWVGTDLAVGFYQRCGWTLLETFTTDTGQHMDVLHKKLV
jgi:GNAT superfamily N-acetyltransferase